MKIAINHNCIFTLQDCSGVGTNSIGNLGIMGRKKRSTDPCQPYVGFRQIADPSDPTCRTYLQCSNRVTGSTVPCWGSTKFSIAKGQCGQAGDWQWVDDCPAITRHTSDYLDLSFNPALVAQRKKNLKESRQEIRG